MHCEQEHEFNCLWKKEGNDYSVQVMEIPGIIIGGKNNDEITNELQKATKSYLDAHEPTHIKAQQNKLPSSLSTSSRGIILRIDKFSVRC